MSEKPWYYIKDTSSLNSPSLLVYPERIEENILTMVSMAGSISNLRPHIKTHKAAEIIKMQQGHGIQKFKCATIAEAELLGQCNAEDVLLAMQPVVANIDRFFKLMSSYPKTRFSALVDNATTLSQITEKAQFKNKIISLFLDINSGMHRTGCIPNEKAQTLYTSMEKNPHIHACGLHVYDGHIHQSDIATRTNACNQAFDKVLNLKEVLKKNGIIVPDIIAGGSPTFPIHALRKGVDTSPGTTLLWDAGYGKNFPDMHFIPAAVLFIRIISKPAENTLCFDLGHKSIAPEMSFPRVLILGLEDSKQTGQSEEHLIVKTQRSDEFQVGDSFYAIPTHICPTVAKYNEMLTVKNREITGAWKVAARNQKITI